MSTIEGNTGNQAHSLSELAAQYREQHTQPQRDRTAVSETQPKSLSQNTTLENRRVLLIRATAATLFSAAAITALPQQFKEDISNTLGGYLNVKMNTITPPTKRFVFNLPHEVPNLSPSVSILLSKFPDNAPSSHGTYEATIALNDPSINGHDPILCRIVDLKRVTKKGYPSTPPRIELSDSDYLEKLEPSIRKYIEEFSLADWSSIAELYSTNLDDPKQQQMVAATLLQYILNAK
jgi:hypothetical protein